MKFHQKPAIYVGEVQLKVSNLKESVRFYTDIIGLSVKEASATSVSFTTNGQDTLLTIIEPEDVQPKKEQRTGLYHFALLLPTRADLAQVVRRFVESDVRFGSGDHLVSEALYVADPDGNGIEIYVDRDPSEWKWESGEVEMTTDPVDFESLLKEEAINLSPSLPRDTVMGHVHLQVNNLEENERFYIEGLGFSVVNRYGNAALFISDYQYHHHIAFNTWAGQHIRHSEPSETGLAAYTLVFPSEAVRDAKITSLKAIGETIYEENGSYYTYDPSQTKIILAVDPSDQSQ